jgi:hypothetical protein
MFTDINYIGGPDYFKISGPDRGPDCGLLKLISTFKYFSLGSNLVFSSLTS